ncbi:hypothetical protein QUF76_04735 [Desulfobacterales bacterium HSG16]|nr:hypothetical protein [Desulfobacterales bacterium HSG16]
MKRNLILKIVAGIASLVFLNSCMFFKSIQPFETGNISATARVLIAAQASEFKENILTKIVNGFEKEPVYIKVIDIQKLKKESAENFQAIVIINTCVAWRMSAAAADFIKKTKENQKYRVILFSTADDENWLPEKAGVDAVTSASRPEKSNQVANIIIKRIRMRIENHL